MSIPKKLFLSLLLSTTIVIFVEGILHFLDIPSKGMYEGDPATLWTVRPNLKKDISQSAYSFQVRSNSLGFRGEEIEERAWLALGCSTTFGWGVEEEETWVHQLSTLIKHPITNAGVPGWSTHQAAQKVADWNRLQPPVVLVSYIVRDSQLSHREDKDAQPSPLWSHIQIFRLLQQGLRKPSQEGSIARVSPEDYRENLQKIQSAFPNSKIVFFAFPQKKPAKQWVSVLQDYSALSLPQLEESDFFAADPIHLNVMGNTRLAEALKSSLVDAAILPPSN